MNVPDYDIPRVVIIGCGFAGLRLAKTISSKHYQVVLLDKNNFHTFQPLLYQVSTAGLEPDSIVYPIRKIFEGKKNFHFRMTEVEEIDEETQHIRTPIGELRYDYLVIATGANSNFFGMENIERFAMPMKSITESLDLRSMILQNFETALNTTDLKERERLMSFVIVGAGPTGVELAGALAELKQHVLPNDYPDLDLRVMQIHVVEAASRTLSAMSEHASEKSEKFLRKMGVNIWLDTKVKDYDGKEVVTDRKTFPTETMIWSAGVKAVSPKAKTLEYGPANRILVDEYFHVKGSQNVFAIGDVAAMITADTPKGDAMLASVANQQGGYIGKLLNAMAKGRTLKPFHYKDKGTMATIGRNKAVVDLPNTNFSGAFAWFIWMFVHLMLLVDFRNRLIVFTNWTWSYFQYDHGIRLIIRKPKRPMPIHEKITE
jgi:NADH dehydrogenase